ncbi:4Fe-4S binding protein [uncultured Methanobrevibacter sp.]|uniref:4Fe-4S binding protein n=1 Tax=uncultured Methanobrevibacter sp. TaxID=253161 RepID=UPI00260D700F|nr:4Fe-4S binding protein [uncultured Methanobrevibacter sp.]
MKTFTKIAKIYFSPSNTTRKIVDEIANKFEGTQEEYNLLSKSSENISKEFDKNTLVIVGMPIFAGRLPKTSRDKLTNFKGENNPTIAIVNYGNANIGDALLELNELLKENEFNIIGTGATISQHSIITDIATGRPDNKDLDKLYKFIEQCKDKLKSEKFNNITVPGNKPYCEYKKVPLTPTCDESSCIFCYECVSSCPEGAIPDMDPTETSPDLCSACTACIFACPEDARYFTGELFESMKTKFLNNFSKRKESEFYL